MLPDAIWKEVDIGWSCSTAMLPPTSAAERGLNGTFVLHSLGARPSWLDADGDPELADGAQEGQRSTDAQCQGARP